MEKGSTIVLRTILVGMGLLVLTAWLFVVPAIYTGWAEGFPDVAYQKWPLIAIFSISALCFFQALRQAWKLLGYIDRNVAFSERSIAALRNIKWNALVISVAFALALPSVYHMAQTEDAPGLMVIGMFFSFAPFVIAVFAAVCQKLLRSGIELKTENDLTV